MPRPDAVLQSLRQLGRKLRRKARSVGSLASWNPLAELGLLLQPKPIPVPVPVRATRRR